MTCNDEFESKECRERNFPEGKGERRKTADLAKDFNEPLQAESGADFLKDPCESYSFSLSFPYSSQELLPGHELYCEIREATAVIDDVSVCLKKINKIADEKNAFIICLNEENIAGLKHIESAIFHAGRSWFEDKPISNSFEMEVLLYTGGTRQCSLAGAFGLHKGKNNLYICVCIKKEGEKALKNAENIFQTLSVLPNFGISADEKNHKNPGMGDKKWENTGKEKMCEEKIKRIMEKYEISKDEINSVGIEKLTELVLERVALLDVQK